MRKKGLFLTLGVILLLLAGVFTYSIVSSDEKAELEESTQTANDSKEQQQVKIGILQTTSHPALDAITEGSIDGLEENGFIDGENAEIILQNAQGDQNLMNTMAQSLVEQGADLLVGIGTPASQALANATADIPIIMGAVSDPVGAGLVETEENPGKNITGVKNEAPVDAQLAMMAEILPEAEEIGLLYSSGEDNSKAEGERAEKAIEAMGLTPITYTVSSTNEIQQTVAAMAREVDVIYLPTDNTIASAFDTVVSEANRHGIPLIPTVDTMIQQGGLATVGINQTSMGFEAGRMGAEVLQGQDPGKLPVFVLSEGEKLLNRQQADLLSIEIPQSVLEKATIIQTGE